MLALHELRYLLAFGDQTTSVLERTGHGYLAAVVPVCGVVLAAGLSWCLLQAAVGPTQAAGHRSMSRRRFWVLASAALLVIFVGQELVEGWTSTGHPDGLSGVFGAGGWTVIPLALALGGLVTLFADIAERAERTICRLRGSRHPRAVVWDRDERPCVLIERAAPSATEPLARHLAGRGPPAVLRTH